MITAMLNGSKVKVSGILNGSGYEGDPWFIMESNSGYWSQFYAVRASSWEKAWEDVLDAIPDRLKVHVIDDDERMDYIDFGVVLSRSAEKYERFNSLTTFQSLCDEINSPDGILSWDDIEERCSYSPNGGVPIDTDNVMLHGPVAINFFDKADAV